jgi:tetratricopeptide (TPR) repeat protein
MSKGLEYFRQAIDIDPTYALAYAGIAASYMPMIYYCYVPPKEGALKGKAAARKALEIEPELSEARTVLAVMKTLEDRDYLGAAEDLRAIIESDPNYGWARQLLAEILTVNGHFELAFRETERALEIDPLSLPLNAFAALERYYARQYGEAIEQCLRTIEMEPNFYLTRSILGMAYGQQGRFAEAAVELRQAERLSSRSPITLANLGALHAAWGQQEEARTILRELEAPTAGQYVSPTLHAFILAGLGDTERALTCLELACEERDPQLVWMKVEPRFDRLRAEPRFQAVLRRMALA